MGVKCFFLEETTMRGRWLRRFVFSEKGSECPITKGGHDAKVFLDNVHSRFQDAQSSGDNWPHDDPRWPKTCACGYEFKDGDEWMLYEFWLYRRSDTGELTTIREAPPGALWYCDWMLTEGSDLFRGPDGHSLCARLPNGRDWHIDGHSANCTDPDEHKHKCWVRHGDPRNPETLAVDKNGHSCAAGGGSIQSDNYHGFLRNGAFTN